jgi:hypothetical protein
MLWADGVSVLVSESGGGKTFVGLDLASAIATGVPWFGRETVRGSVIYLLFEGALKYRLTALHETKQRGLEHVHVIEAKDPISPVARDGEHPSKGELEIAAAIDALQAELVSRREPPIVLLIVDTARASMTGSEDSSEHVAAYLRALRRLMGKVPGSALLLMHHSGWQDDKARNRKRERGSSTWRGNVDATFYLEVDQAIRTRGTVSITLQTNKVRDGEIPPPLHLVRKTIELPTRDRRGRPITSCIIELDERPREEIEAARANVVLREEEALEQKVLQVVATEPVTSKTTIQQKLNIRNARVSAAVDRLCQRDWIRQERRTKPFTLTPAGDAARRQPE